MMKSYRCARLILASFILLIPIAVDSFVNNNGRVQRTRSALFASDLSTTSGDGGIFAAPSDEVNPVEEYSSLEEITAFDTLAGNVARCLVRSDMKRERGGDGASTGWTSWVDEESALGLQTVADALALRVPIKTMYVNKMPEVGLLERDEVLRWMKWMKAIPAPMIIELSRELREAANKTVSDVDLERVDTTRDELLSRMGLRLILLPSGSQLSAPIRTPAGAMAYGKLLYGGVKRYRLLPGGRYGMRRAGERTAILANDGENVESWLQYGGPLRNYEAVDMGPCAVLETLVLPKGVSLSSMFDGDDENEMALSQLPNFCSMLRFFEPDTKGISSETRDKKNDDDPLLELSGKELNDRLEETFTTTVGGLGSQIDSIVRRVLDGRVIRPVGPKNGEINELAFNSRTMMEAEELASLGLNPVKGLLLYGPPGCGKTVLAREMSKALRARPPVIVSAPELLDRWVGGSEKLVRSLFKDAEDELAACNYDATKSALHIIVIDEIDAVFRIRSSAEDSGEATRASAVNQILAKLDGVNAMPNVLLIGMTNRRELLDEALLRPGRLEVQVEIPLPTRDGRREILQIHFEALRRKGRLSQRLCQAIDSDGLKKNRRGKIPLALTRARDKLSTMLPLSTFPVTDLSTLTEGFSGADIAGLVRCAGSLALARARQRGDGVDGLLITLDDVVDALEEVKG